MKNSLIFLFLITLLVNCKPAILDDQALLSYADMADADLIKRHIAVLSDDSLRGRLPGTPEYEEAMQYVIDQYQSLGIKPLGNKEGSSYLQPMTFRKSIIDESSSYLILNNQDTAKVGMDYFFLGNSSSPELEFEGELVIAGYGIDAAQFGYNDFENLEVKDKIVVIYNGGPDVLPATERAHFSNTNTKINTLSEKGALGIIFTTFPEGRGSFKGSYDRYSKGGIVSVKMPDGEFAGRSNYGNMKFGGYFDWEFIRKITANDVDLILEKYLQGEVTQPNNTIFLKGKIVNNFSEFESSNVVGVLEGAELKNEYVIHTAHLDHVGVGTPVNGDSIYNGAHDNASGISAMLEIARLYSELPSKPKRSVIFAAVTAEEMGLLGSLYLAENPVVPAESIIANVNTDMPTMVGPLVSVEPLGAEQSSIMKIVERSTSLLGLKIDEDHLPEEVRFVRSDNYSFVKAGIPALRMKFGIQTKDSPTGLDSAITHMMSQIYHKPSDELGASFNFEGAKTYVELQFMNSYLINTSETRPTWNEDSFFKRFER
ncbi:M28 family peptidase [Algoriphagus halophilus]|uniref:Zn-dependent amino-or carboxypeptidase, M28 family n=1 Tax=Algoriphagus halophilus TaxID=226505 RepID=A0A1N6DUH8_9BACT|nr:M28 family peptidase [Algoriphagus halophilus]SIN74458.1 Zn-dependent amino-or carboxypeptidase, M28 family [Algoriphagus halophilus]